MVLRQHLYNIYYIVYADGAAAAFVQALMYSDGAAAFAQHILYSIH